MSYYVLKANNGSFVKDKSIQLEYQGSGTIMTCDFTFNLNKAYVFNSEIMVKSRSVIINKWLSDIKGSVKEIKPYKITLDEN